VLLQQSGPVKDWGELLELPTAGQRSARRAFGLRQNNGHARKRSPAMPRLRGRRRGGRIRRTNTWSESRSMGGACQGAAGLTVPMTDGEMKIGGKLPVPLRDADGKLWNLQIIDGDGSKLFLPGRKKGLSFVEGLLDDGGAVLIGEGVATMKTLRATTSLTTVAAIDSGNLLAVATSVRSAHPEKPVIFAADNDHQLPRREKPLPNVGLVKAREGRARRLRGCRRSVVYTRRAGDGLERRLRHSRKGNRQDRDRESFRAPGDLAAAPSHRQEGLGGSG
jgi:hypothetical protein